MVRRSLAVIGNQGLRVFVRLAFIGIRKRPFFRYEFGPAVNQRSAAEPLTVPLQAQKEAQFGANLAGFFTGQFGIASSSRAFADALKFAEVPHVLNNIVAEIHGERRKISSIPARTNPYAINLVHVNADLAEHFFDSNGPLYSEGKYNIGIWYWELSKFPARWLPAFRFYDEIWATSSFTRDCLSRISPVPVVKIRYPLFLDTDIVDSKARKKLDLAEDLYVFLFMFDFGGIFERKNPLAVVKAFGLSFGRDERALLVLNHINSWFNPAAAKILRRASSGLNVTIIDRHLSERDYLSLLAASDCYVSLHRSEGLGLTMAEAMFLGKPVIATAYSGNMDFMNVNNSLLVEYELAELKKDYGPYEKGNVWAEPDIEHAAELMRWVYDNPDKAGTMGKRASSDIRQYMNPTLASQGIRERLVYIYERFGSTTSHDRRMPFSSHKP
jgi:glycosyltransferase involved in cell wall biosynthesis